MHYVILGVLALSLLFAPPACADRLTAQGGNYFLQHNPRFGTTQLFSALFRQGVDMKSQSEIKKVSDSVYHLNLSALAGRYFKIDAEHRSVSEVSGGKFGAEGGNEAVLPMNQGVRAIPFLFPDGSLSVPLFGATLDFDTATGDLTMGYGGDLLFGREYFEVASLGNGIYHVRMRGPQPQERFVKLDLKRTSVSSVTGVFGTSDSGEIPFDRKALVEASPVQQGDNAVHQDLGMVGVEKKESAWISAEAGLFQNVLGRRQYDLLVVPFQVQDYAFDQPERMLMTEKLVDTLRLGSDLRIPDPFLVERALGTGLRTFSEESVFALAKTLGVKKVIRGYVGHDRDLKMRVTVVAQDGDAGGPVSRGSKRKETVLKDIAFSDEKLPSESLDEQLPQILPAVGSSVPRHVRSMTKADLAAIPLPATPFDMIATTDVSNFTQAAHLAVLGAVSPAGTSTAESFFVRSLAQLHGLSLSSDTRFLKAYLLASLLRRPAALALLKDPATVEEKALRASVDGDLVTLSALIPQIKGAIPKLLLTVDLADVRGSYDPQSFGADLKNLVEEFPAGWKPFLERRFAFLDVWYVPDAAELKLLLDERYPVQGLSLQDLARTMLVRGGDPDSGSTAIDTSIHAHRNQLLRERPELAGDESVAGVTPLDALELLTGWGEQSVLKNVFRRASVQAMYEDAVHLADRYEQVWPDHPELTILKGRGLRSLAVTKKGEGRDAIYKKAVTLHETGALWSRGQTQFSNYAWSPTYFENDFPRRPYWTRHGDAGSSGDRKKYQLKEVDLGSHPNSRDERMRMADLRDAELAFRYTGTDATTMERYHELLVTLDMHVEAASLLERNRHRFNGNPKRVPFLAALLEKKGDAAGVIALYEEAIRATPRASELYSNLGVKYLERGEVQKSVETFNRFPLLQGAAHQGSREQTDMVSIANSAYNTGRVLHRDGETSAARTFYELSAGYGTGSGSEMRSEYFLALFDGDFRSAAQSALTRARRYLQPQANSEYLRILATTGKFSDVESLYFSLNMRQDDWDPIITAFRVSGASDEKMRQWLKEKGKGTAGQQSFYLAAFLWDRTPDAELSERIADFDHSSIKSIPRTTAWRAYSTPVAVAASHYAIMKRDYPQAYAVLSQFYTRTTIYSFADGRFLFPWFVWSGSLARDEETVRKALATYEIKRGRDFEYFLATAMLQAATGKHEESLRSLTTARYRIHNVDEDGRPADAWYQLVEACELMYGETKEESYKFRAYELAKIHRKVNPLDAWAYGIIARFSTNERERDEAVGMALYLDPRSRHLSDLSTEEREKAQKRMQKNNPFIRNEGSDTRSTI